MINYPKDSSLGSAEIQAFPKKQYEKIKEIIDEVNSISDDGVIIADSIVPTLGSLTIQGGISNAGFGIMESDKFSGPIETSSFTADGATVTQATSITTGVTINKISGLITTVSSTLAAGSSATFTVSNDNVDTNDLVFINVNQGSSTGIAIGYVTNITSNAFDIVIRNIHGATAFNNTIKISFFVVKQV